MSNAQYNNSPSPESNPFAQLFTVLTDTSLSVEARHLYAILKLMAWSKGVCWAGIKKQAEYMGRSEDSIRRYHEELEKSKVLLVDRVPGRVNHYYPASFVPPSFTETPRTHTPPTPRTGAALTSKEEHINKTLNVSAPKQPLGPPPAQPSNVNAINETLSKSNPTIQTDTTTSLAPEPPEPPTPKSHALPRSKVAQNSDPNYLVRLILETTNDHHSKGAWYRISREVPEQNIYQALSITREKIATDSGVNAGRYFLGTIKGLTSFSFTPSPFAHACPHEFPGYQQVPDTDIPSVIPPVSVGRPDAESIQITEPDDEIITADNLIKGWKQLYQHGNVSSVLFFVEQCLARPDVRQTWELLKQERPDTHEELVLDEFLELMAVRYTITSGGTS